MTQRPAGGPRRAPAHRGRTGLLRLASGVAAALVTAVVVGAGAAAQADDGTHATIAHAEPTPQGLQVLVSIPADATVDLAHVTATVNGHPAPATADLAASTTTVRRTAVLAIDTSNSMRGSKWAAARAAAQAFISAVPDDVSVGIVTFAGDVTTALAPTQDRASALGTLDHLALSSHTRLYDGVVAAVKEAGTDGQRSLLVLSDGADTSTTPIGDAVSAITDAGVLTDVVALDQKGSALASLGRLATAGQGQVIAADPAALQAAFATEAQVLARQVLVTVQVPDAAPKTEGTLTVVLPTQHGDLSAEAYTKVRSAP